MAINILVQVPNLCSSQGSVIVLPSVLYLVLGVLRESSRIDSDQLMADSNYDNVTMAATTALLVIKNFIKKSLIKAVAEL